MNADEKKEATVIDIETGAPTAPIATEAEKKPFAETAIAAKLSGTFHQTAGKLKQKWGEFSDNPDLKVEGRNQEILGKIHRLVGTFRDVRQTVIKKYETKKQETKDICIKHGVRMIDVASDFVEDLKKTFLK